jgi:hypothetical protein
VQEALSWVPAGDGPGDGPPEVLIVDDNADMRAGRGPQDIGEVVPDQVAQLPLGDPV